MSFATCAFASVGNTVRGAIRDAQERQRLGLPPRYYPELVSEPPRRVAEDPSTALLAGVFGYAIGSSHSHSQPDTSPSYDPGSSCTPSTSDSFSSGGGGDFGGGGATGDW